MLLVRSINKGNLLNPNHHHYLEANNLYSIWLNKIFCCQFFNCQGDFIYTFISEGTTVNKEMHIDILGRLREAFRRKCLEKRRTKSLFLLHENAPLHRSVVVKDFLAKNNVTTPEHTPYPHDLASADFYLFPRMKLTLKGRRFL